MVAESTDDGRLSRSTCRALLFVLLATLLAQVWTLSRVEGYRLADSVEYMDRAHDTARGRGLGPESPRSFAFSAILLPAFYVAEALDLRDLRGVVLAVRMLQVLFGLGAVATVIVVGARAVSPACGLAAGLLLGTSPVFLQYTIEPLAGTAAALAILLGFRAALAPGGPASGRSRRAGIVAGSWLGFGALLAYQTLPVTGVLIGFLVVRGRWRGRALWASLFLTYLGWLVLQCFLDLAIYGAFGSTLVPYLADNVGAVVVRICYVLHLHGPGRWIYEHVLAPAELLRDSTGALAGEVRALQPPDWYLTRLTELAVPWPALVLVAAGAILLFTRRSWVLAAALGIVVLNVAILSLKGAKSFRLWMPILPYVALMAGAGFAALHERRVVVARALAWTGLVWACVLGLGIARDTNLAEHGGYWQAMDELASRADPAAPIRTSATYHWAARFRARRGINYFTLPHHLDRWKDLTEEERAETLTTLRSCHAFLTHLPVLHQDPRIAELLGREFRVAGIFWDPRASEAVGPVALFARPRVEPEGRVLLETEPLPEGGREAYLERVQHPSGVGFGEGDFEVTFLGWDLETGIAGGRGAWVTYHWLAERVDGNEHTIRDRLTDNLARELWNNSERGYGALATSTWSAGEVVRESYFVSVPSSTRRFGGPYARGELVPLELWVSVGSDASDAPPLAVRLPFEGSGLEPPSGESSSREHHRPIGARGTRWTRDGMVLVGGTFLPVPDHPSFPTDGGPP